MKKLISVLIVLAMLCSFACMAEENSIETQAKNIISVVNYFVSENTDIDQLFTGFQPVVEDEIFGFYTDDNSIQALLVADAENNAIDSCSFICDAPAVMQLALNCASFLPMAQLVFGDDASIGAAMQEDMIAMAEWLDENQADALTAFEEAAFYTVTFAESDLFYLELVIVPMDEGARMMASYYFHAPEAEA